MADAARSTPETVGFIGLGNMGWPMAARQALDDGADHTEVVCYLEPRAGSELRTAEGVA